MTELAIEIDSLSKRYRIGHAVRRPDSLGQAVVQAVRAPFRYLSYRLSKETEEDTLWALKDVSFQVQKGDVVGLIGRNGAGKSTLLKVLSKITDPTSGRARILGRVNSLLEVGTGFHPELTGRENVYLSAAIHGMRKAEVDRSFDEIVAFAGVERFIDTPVKRYSSGMGVRLGFAVAAHLDPEILLVDEVLAVGDAAFQKKCLGRMSDAAKGGRTVLFVSHNMNAVQSLCSRTIWLESGSVQMEGPTEDVVREYLKKSMMLGTETERVWRDPTSAPGDSRVRVHRLCVRPEGRTSDDEISMETPLLVEMEYWNYVPGANFAVTLHFFTEQGILAFVAGMGSDPLLRDLRLEVGLYRAVCRIPGNLLNSGGYSIKAIIVKDASEAIHVLDDALSFEVLDLSPQGFGWQGRDAAAVRPALQWTTQRVEALDVSGAPGLAPAQRGDQKGNE